MKKHIAAARPWSFVLALLMAALLTFASAAPANAADTVTMPKVVGKAANKAQTKLMTKGIIVKLKAASDGPVFVASHWKVTKQSVKAGKKVSIGKKVTLTVKLKKQYAPTASPTATPIAAPLEADLKSQWGVTNFTDGLAGTSGHDPSLLNWTISEITDQSAGIVHVTVQVTSAETAGAEVEQLAKNIMRLEQDRFPELNWVVVQTADGSTLKQSPRLAAGN